jgi:hypothetical protein
MGLQLFFSSIGPKLAAYEPNKDLVLFELDDNLKISS